MEDRRGKRLLKCRKSEQTRLIHSKSRRKYMDISAGFQYEIFGLQRPKMSTTNSRRCQARTCCRLRASGEVTASHTHTHTNTHTNTPHLRRVVKDERSAANSQQAHQPPGIHFFSVFIDIGQLAAWCFYGWRRGPARGLFFSARSNKTETWR